MIVVEEIARVCHEANRGVQRNLGNFVSPPWDEATKETRDCTIQGVYNVLAGMSFAECHADWVRQRAENGWRYGSVKDDFSKLHPCMVPFEELPAKQQMKNYIFASIVEAISGVKGGVVSGGDTGSAPVLRERASASEAE